MAQTRKRPSSNDSVPVMPNESPASKFIEEAVNHPEWLKTIEAGPADAVVKLAQDNGFETNLNDLKIAAKQLLGNGSAIEPSKEAVDEAASGMSDFQNDTGYGDDTGYAALYGVAGTILKL